ncbi:beta-ketoacyl-[acyl-carrier-protein] synthase family protein [Candidatus Methylocalor cossyra]|uniref:Beta-ketoacyl-[acyl-carrier-protein] synthase family protein n=1 Tax=Candidatus Methylocalor cossyra TaxID=3108543 RepID=A0ABM9NHK4_9GAMM
MTVSRLIQRFPELVSVQPMPPVRLKAWTLVSALGAGVAATLAGLRERRSGLRPCDFLEARLPTWIGRVEGLERAPVIDRLARYDSRNHRLAQLCLEQDGFAAAVAEARRRHGPERIAVVLGTSTSGILETERAYRQRDPETGSLPPGFSYRHTHNAFAGVEFVRQYLRLAGPGLAISTACSSSAKVFASATRMLAAGLCDAVVAGGVDSLCLTTLYGFSALELTSDQPCRPADADRRGISIGEGAGFALLERASGAEGGLALLGYGESSDAYHMSSPHPEGRGAALAMAAALLRAGRDPEQVDYVLLHGTGTRSNDSAEDRALCAVLGPGVPCSSVKGWIGHTLGAAGVLNALIACLCLETGFAPPSLNTERVDPEFSAWVLQEELRRPLATILSNAFGFGGNNASLLLGRVVP